MNITLRIFLYIFSSWKYSVVIICPEKFTCVAEKVLFFPIEKKPSSVDLKIHNDPFLLKRDLAFGKDISFCLCFHSD